MAAGYRVSVSDLCQSLLLTRDSKTRLETRQLIWDEFAKRCPKQLSSDDFSIRIKVCTRSWELAQIYEQFIVQGFAITPDVFLSVVVSSVSCHVGGEDGSFDVLYQVLRTHKAVIRDLNSVQQLSLFTALSSLKSLAVLKSIWSLVSDIKMTLSCYVLLIRTASHGDCPQESLEIATLSFNRACQLSGARRNIELWKAMIYCCYSHGYIQKSRWYADQAVKSGILTLSA
eukprot:TRINITY_DN779_c7_g1_i1.p1 TRINITY_DN779_c7_g1~~TRINITY_DN779_c7_g1_i1.p1  ORF type:complete len:229 (+),score=10.84 TRINITY_DN779_c7_g1_i1:467-1153(+)